MQEFSNNEDISATGLCAAQENPGIKKETPAARLRVRTAGVLGLTQTDGKRSARENNQGKPERGLSVQ